VTLRLSPVLTGLKTYPFVRLTEAKQRVAARGVDIIDLGMGEPREETPEFIRAALADAIPRMSGYPPSDGFPALREAIAGWVQRRFAVTLDAASEVLPTLGSKEAIFHLAEAFGGDLVAVPAPSYPVYERGAVFAGQGVLELPLAADRGFLPDLAAVPADAWNRVSVLWLNYPNNPTAATATLELYEQAASLAREHGFVVASDEAYSELYFGDTPPVSALEVGDRTNVVALNTLSKRSAMPGYRSGFVAGDPAVIAALKRYRPNVGTAIPDFVQAASIAAWGDEAHVARMRETYRVKRDAILPAFEARGLRHAGGDATFFLWLDAGPDAEALAAEWLERGVVVAPGSYFGPAGEGYLRVALVQPLEDCRRAAELVA
jgi:succinyldiaminopimelate transaminase